MYSAVKLSESKCNRLETIVLPKGTYMTERLTLRCAHRQTCFAPLLY